MSKDKRDDPYERLRKPVPKPGRVITPKNTYNRSYKKKEEEEIIEEGIEEFYKEQNNG